MPIIKSAKKKQRADKTKEKRNNLLRISLKSALKNASKKPTLVNISKASKIADKLAKNNLIHKNKAARIKSSLSKLLPKKTVNSPKKPSRKTK